MIRAVILAAGQSSRMGRPKAGLRVTEGGPTFAAAVAATLQAAGLGEVTVVSGAHPVEVAAALRGLEGVRLVHNAGWPAGQLSSLRCGLNAIDAPGLEAMLVTLVDIPLVRRDTVETLVREWRASRAAVVRPAIGPRHGHPVIFDRVTFDDLRRGPLDAGAKAVIAAWAAQVRNVPVDDRGVLLDVDTPSEYEALRRDEGR